MAAKKTQIGTFVVRQCSKKTTYPVHRADFGVLKYSDTCEIWFDVGAGQAIAGDKPSKDDEYEPRMHATVYEEELDVSDLSGMKFSILAPFEDLVRPCSEAFLHWYADYGEPERLGPCTIRIGEKQNGVYPVRWKATLDFYSGTRPDEKIEIAVNVDFTFRGVKEVPCSLDYTSRRPFDRWMLMLVPICGLAGYIASKYTAWLNWWGGILVGLVVATYIAQKIDYRWQHKVWNLKQGGQGRVPAVPDDGGEEE